MNKRWYVCDLCGKSLSSYKCLWRHKKMLHHNPNRKAIHPSTVSNDESFRVKSLDEDQYYNATDGANSAMNETYNRSPLENVRKSNIVRRNHNLTSSSLEQNHDEESDEEMFEPLPKGDIATYAWRNNNLFNSIQFIYFSIHNTWNPTDSRGLI